MTVVTSAPARGPSSSGGAHRPLTVSAVAAGLLASAGVLVVCMAIGIAGWLTSGGGGHGGAVAAMRVGADAWLLAHGAHLELTSATVSVVPLGLTLLCGYVCHRLGRWVALTSGLEDARGALAGAAILSGVYAAVTVLTAVLASLEQAQPRLGLASAGGFVVSFVCGGAGVVSGCGRWPGWRSRLPEPLRATATGALSVVLLLLALSSALVAAALFLHLGSAVSVLSRLHTDTAGGILYTLVVASVAPNAVLLGGAYLLGPGFAVGTGTLVSPTAVSLGPVPAFPLLAALPDGPAPGWLGALVAVPVLSAALSTALTARRHSVAGYPAAALRGLSAGVCGAVVVGLLLALAGGSVGPGRMSDVGAPVAETLLVAVAALGAGGLVGAVAMTWWRRRRQQSDAPGGSTDGAASR